MSAIELPRKLNLRRDEASRYLDEVWGVKCAASTLSKLASTGGGPGFHKPNATPVYPRDELDRWAKEKLGPLLKSSSDAGEE